MDWSEVEENDPPRYWAILSIYRALNRWTHGQIEEEQAAKDINWEIQRYRKTIGLEVEPLSKERLFYLMNPDMGAELDNMGEWAEWILSTSGKGKKGNNEH